MTAPRFPRARPLILAAAIAVPLLSTPAAAQQPAGRPMDPVRVTPTTVTRVVLLDVKPGQRPALDRDVMAHSIPIWEEYKRAGIIVDYAIFSNVTVESPGDWDVGYTLTYANYAALDNLADRTRPILLKHYGSEDRQRAAGEARINIATIVSSKLLRGLRYGPGAP